MDERRQFLTGLFERHRGPLLNYLHGLLAHRDDAEEVLQESYMRVLALPELELSETRARGLLYRVATNLAYDRHRRRRTRGETMLDRDPPSNAAPPEHLVGLSQAMDALAEVLGQLAPRTRRVFLLRFAEHMPYVEIAERLGISKRTVEREIQTAVAACQQRLKR